MADATGNIQYDNVAKNFLANKSVMPKGGEPGGSVVGSGSVLRSKRHTKRGIRLHGKMERYLAYAII